MNIIIDTNPRDTFQDVAEKAKIAAKQAFTAEFDFNGIKCMVNKNTNLEYLFRDYCTAHIMDFDTVGPYCLETYPEIVQQELDKRRAAQEEKRKEAQAAYDLQLQQRQQAIDATGEQFDCIDEAALQNWKDKNTHGYGGAVIKYAINWALLMQHRVKDGSTLEAVADKASHDADTEGITGFMYGCAVQMLLNTWRHGEALRVWHNAQYNHSGAGVVNPAILTINTE